VKRSFVLAIALTALVAVAPAARAHDAYDDSEANPLRIVAYAINPIGFALEWLVTRPIHMVVSQPQLEPVFGHVPHEDPYTPYQPYGRADLWYPGGYPTTDNVMD
jgi:hypothetical protein